MRFLATATDRRRLALCIALAVLLHAATVVVRKPLKPKVEPLATAQREQPMTIPVSLDEAPLPAPTPPPSPSPPEADPNQQPPTESAPRVLVKKSDDAVPPPAPVNRPRPAPESGVGRLRDDASAFGGRTGAFRAHVCLLPRGAESAMVVDGCKPVASFMTNELNVSPRRFKRGFPGVERKVEWFGIDYRGRFKVKKAGYYTFRLLSDDGAVLFIDGARVLDNDGTHSPRSVTIAMPLSAGEHDFRLLYFQGPGHELALQLFVKGYKTPERLFGPEI